MRMKYMYYLLKENFDIINSTQGKPIESKERQHYRIDNWQNIIKAYNSISIIPYFSELCKKIVSVQVPLRMFDKLNYETFSVDSYKVYINLHNTLLDKMSTIIDFFEEAGFCENQHGFDIKLPPTKAFSDFVDYIKDLNIIFNQCPFLNIPNETIEIKKADCGSIWLELAPAINTTAIVVGTPILLMNLAKIVDKCVKIKSHIITCKQQEEQLRTEGLKNDLLDSLVVTHKSIIDFHVKKYAEELKTEINDLEPEDEERVRQSLDKLSDMMVKGLEIYASIDSPAEIKDLFPTSDELLSLPEPLKMIEEKVK